MPNEVEDTRAEERPPLESVETRDTTPATGVTKSTDDEVWTLVEVLDSTNLTTSENGSSNITTLDITIEGNKEYTFSTPIDLQDYTTLEEYTFSTPLDLQDSTIQGSSSTDTRATEEVAGYTAYISEAPSTSTMIAEEGVGYTACTPETPPGQYSPSVFIQAKERSREIVGSSINLPYETAGVINEPSPPLPKESILPGIRGILRLSLLQRG